MASVEWDIINNYDAANLSFTSGVLLQSMPEIFWDSLKRQMDLATERFDTNASSYIARESAIRTIESFYANFCMLRSPELFNIVSSSSIIFSDYFLFHPEYTSNAVLEIPSEYNIEAVVDNEKCHVFESLTTPVRLEENAIEYRNRIYSSTPHRYADLNDSIEMLLSRIKFADNFTIHVRDTEGFLTNIEQIAGLHNLESSMTVLTCLIPGLNEYLYTFHMIRPKQKALNPNRCLLRRELFLDGGLSAHQT